MLISASIVRAWATERFSQKHVHTSRNLTKIQTYLRLGRLPPRSAALPQGCAGRVQSFQPAVVRTEVVRTRGTAHRAKTGALAPAKKLSLQETNSAKTKRRIHNQ